MKCEQCKRPMTESWCYGGIVGCKRCANKYFGGLLDDKNNRPITNPKRK